MAGNEESRALLAEIADLVPAWRANAGAARGRPDGAAAAAVLGPADWQAARAEISAWPGYRPTPLVGLPGLAAVLGIARLAVKDEGGRFGLGSFKALGGAYAVLRQLRARVAAQTGETPSTEDLLAGRFAGIAAGLTVCCATDGNHGRSVAWGARTFGLPCVIYLHEHVSAGREAAIARFGAEVRRVEGTYDDSVHRAAEEAARNGWTVVSDTSYEGYREIPRDVMAGYAVMAAEALEQWGEGPPNPGPTHVFLQAGVGGLAAAVCAYLWQSLGARRPRFQVVEPERAACLFASAAEGRAATIGGDLDTVMAGLAAGETSLIAWDVLRHGAEGFMTLPDASAPLAMRLLAAGMDGDPPLVAGESAVAGLAALICARRRPELAEAMGLNAESRVLLFSTEGDTDPELYRELVGRTAAEVRAAKAV
ncbi:MAG: diaminopropionate ammonia-lyase [Kiloniellales bacterium]|nr:diaminopropionate ammonia-lyase [Kiloniellales bacterium]